MDKVKLLLNDWKRIVKALSFYYVDMFIRQTYYPSDK